VAPTPYARFGALLLTLRQHNGIAHQSELAKLLRTTQQTVSRWEAGLSRPRDKQIPLLAKVLGATSDELLAAAGYTAGQTVAVFDQPFPVDALSPESFERFCFYFLEALYPNGQVHRAGERGHKQRGIDIEVREKRKTLTFQCKRVTEFGPRKVQLAVSEHKRKAAKKIILLSRVASPAAREAVRSYTSWDIWDREDISLRIRKLSKDDQRRIVDAFFRGQRLALLGELEFSPWQTTEEFFAPFVASGGLFTHTWKLVGRTAEVDKLVGGLLTERVRILFFVGPAGAGKSRILKESIQRFAVSRPAVIVHVLSPTEEVTKKSLEELGNRDKVLVVDDAHDRTDLTALFQYASVRENNTRLVLALRPYGLERIKSQASRFALLDEETSEIVLNPLSLEESTTLATQVLERHSGPVGSAGEIARLTRDCPLATVIGAQVVARQKVHIELAKNENAFRTTLMSRFRDVVAGGIGHRGDAEPIKKVLRVLALVQPFHPEDRALLKAVERIEGLKDHEVSRLIRLLIEAGVIFKRGGRYRLSPDVLADYIIENECIGHGGHSTGYAERLFETANGPQIEAILLNLGKLDWRRSNGDPSNSRLLDGVWRLLKPTDEYGDPHVKAVGAVAFYQPTRALDFAEGLIREGKFLHGVSNVVRNAAYNFTCLPRACTNLWELGRNDRRELGPHPEHAIRVLNEMCSIELNKPILYNEVVVDFALSLLRGNQLWGRYSPFDILTGILATTGHTTSSNGRTISWNRFSVNSDVVAPLRLKVVDATIESLNHADPRVATAAARCLHEALRYPMDAPSESRNAWTSEFVATLAKIQNTVLTFVLDPMVLIEIGESVSWHAHHADGQTKSAASRILGSIPKSLEFRTILALLDGYGHIIRRLGDKNAEEEWEKDIDAVVSELVFRFGDGEQLRTCVEQHLAHIEACTQTRSPSPHNLYWKLLAASPGLVVATIDNALANANSTTARFAGMALSRLLRSNRSGGLQMAERLQASDRVDLQAAVGEAYCDASLGNDGYRADEIVVLKRTIASPTELVAQAGIGVLRAVAQKQPELALDLFRNADLGLSSQFADKVLALFHADRALRFVDLSDSDVDRLFDQLMRVPRLDGHWLETFLAEMSKTYAEWTAKFFMRRVEYAAEKEDWNYRPCNHGPYGHVPLRFREAPEFGALLRETSQWMKSRDQFLFRNGARELFELMFRPFDDVLVAFLQEWIDVATAEDCRVISEVLSEAHSDFVFERATFVAGYLERARQFGKRPLKDAITSLYRSAISGMRQGIVGEPFPQDLRMKEEAKRILVSTPRFSPAFELYQSIQEHAEQSIQRSLLEAEALEDD